MFDQRNQQFSTILVATTIVLSGMYATFATYQITLRIFTLMSYEIQIEVL